MHSTSVLSVPTLRHFFFATPNTARGNRVTSRPLLIPARMPRGSWLIKAAVDQGGREETLTDDLFGCGLMGSTLMESLKKYYLFDGFEQVLKIYVWDMTQVCMQPSPSRRNNNRRSQPMRTMPGKQRCKPYACARWFPRVCRCMVMYGYICYGRMPAHAKPNTCTYIHVTDFERF